MSRPNATQLISCILGAITLAVLGCSGNEEPEVHSTINRPDWPAISERRVLFAHQSVGANILSGIRQLAARDRVQLTVQEWDGGNLELGISHFKVGKNGDPQSKLAAFRSALASTDGTPPDVAMLKLCYVDFNENTNAKQLALDYVATLDDMAARYPHTVFVAVTAPLASLQSGPKAWLKKVLGIPPGQYVENTKRSEFNAILRNEFGSTNRLFDLAAIESGGQTLSPTDNSDNVVVQSLDPSLTYDGGHLNERGEQLAAIALLGLLSNTPAN